MELLLPSIKFGRREYSRNIELSGTSISVINTDLATATATRKNTWLKRFGEQDQPPRNKKDLNHIKHDVLGKLLILCRRSNLNLGPNIKGRWVVLGHFRSKGELQTLCKLWNCIIEVICQRNQREKLGCRKLAGH